MQDCGLDSEACAEFCQNLLVTLFKKGITRTNLMERVLSTRPFLAKSGNIDVTSTKLQCSKGSALTCVVTGCVGLRV